MSSNTTSNFSGNRQKTWPNVSFSSRLAVFLSREAMLADLVKCPMCSLRPVANPSCRVRERGPTLSCTESSMVP